MKNIIIVICASIFPTLLWANTSSWQCQNTINEVKCKNKNCHSGAVLDSSFKVSIQDHSKVKVCTQNKCWNGHAVSQKNLTKLYIQLNNLVGQLKTIQMPNIPWA